LEKATTDQAKPPEPKVPAASGEPASSPAASPAVAQNAQAPSNENPAEVSFKKADLARHIAEAALKGAEETLKALNQSLAEAKLAAAASAAALLKSEADCERAQTNFAESQAAVNAVAFSPDGQTVATGGDDQLVQTWSAENGAPFDAYAAELGSIRFLSYNLDGRIVSSAQNKGAVLWRTAPSWVLSKTIGSGDAQSTLISRVVSLSFSPDGKGLATGGGAPSRSGEVKIWNPENGTLLREIKNAHSDTVNALEFSADGKYLATASADKFVKVFESASGELAKTLTGHTHYVLGVSWKADGRALASVGADKSLKVWNFPGGEQRQNTTTFSKELTQVRFVGLGSEMLAASGDSRVRLMQEEGKTVREFAGGKGFLFSTAATPDAQTVIGGGEDSVLRIWNATNAKSVWNLAPPPVESVVKKQ